MSTTSESGFLWVGRDATGAWLYKTTIAPGDAYQVSALASEVLTHKDSIVDIFVSDELGRRFSAGEPETRAAIAKLTE
jgi:hypothetical protein